MDTEVSSPVAESVKSLILHFSSGVLKHIRQTDVVCLSNFNIIGMVRVFWRQIDATRLGRAAHEVTVSC